MSAKTKPLADLAEPPEAKDLPETPRVGLNSWRIALIAGALLTVALVVMVRSCNRPSLNDGPPETAAAGARQKAHSDPAAAALDKVAKPAASKAASQDGGMPVKVGQAAPAGDLWAKSERSALEHNRQQLSKLEQRLTQLEAGLPGQVSGLTQQLNQLQAQQTQQAERLQQLEQTLAGLQQQVVAKVRRPRRIVRPPQVKVVAIDRWGDQWQAVIEDQGLHILRAGSKLAGWTVQQIRPEGLTLVLGRRKVVIPPS